MLILQGGHNCLSLVASITARHRGDVYVRLHSPAARELLAANLFVLSDTVAA